MTECNHEPFEQFLPFQVYRSGFRAWIGRAFGAPMEYAVICRKCKEIVGYEPISPSVMQAAQQWADWYGAQPMETRDLGGGQVMLTEKPQHQRLYWAICAARPGKKGAGKG